MSKNTKASASQLQEAVAKETPKEEVKQESNASEQTSQAPAPEPTPPSTPAPEGDTAEQAPATDAPAADQKPEIDPAAAAAQDQAASGDDVKETPAEDQTPPGDQGPGVIEPDPVALAETTTLLVTPTPITPAAPAPTAPAVVAKKEAAAVVVESKVAVSDNAELSVQLASILKDVPSAFQIDINRILAYLKAMAPRRPVDVKTGCAEQLALYKSIQNIVNRQEAHFVPLFTALLAIFKSEGKGALGDRYRMRFMDNVVLPAGDRKAFSALTTMLCILADPRSRELAMQQINMERALENGLTVEGRTRILAYFNL